MVGGTVKKLFEFLSPKAKLKKFSGGSPQVRVRITQLF